MISFQNISLLAKNTIQKEVRNKTILFLFVFTIIVLLLAYSLINILFSQVADETMLTNFGLGMPSLFISVLSLWTSMIALLVGVNVIRSDMDDKVLPQLLALPITRLEYMIARLFGSWIIVMSFYLLCMLFTYFLFFLISREFTSVVLLFKSLPALSVNIFIILWVSMFFSQYFPKLFALVSTSFTLFIVRFSNGYFSQKEVLEVYKEGDILGSLLSVFYFLFPRMGQWAEVNSLLITGKEISVSMWPLALHTTFSSILIFLLAFWLFKKKDI